MPGNGSPDASQFASVLQIERELAENQGVAGGMPAAETLSHMLVKGATTMNGIFEAAYRISAAVAIASMAALAVVALTGG
jgi:hypothetical protein